MIRLEAGEKNNFEYKIAHWVKLSLNVLRIVLSTDIQCLTFEYPRLTICHPAGHSGHDNYIAALFSTWVLITAWLLTEEILTGDWMVNGKIILPQMLLHRLEMKVASIESVDNQTPQFSRGPFKILQVALIEKINSTEFLMLLNSWFLTMKLW